MVKILTPAITIFNSWGKPDWEGNKRIIDHLVRGGVDGALVLGSTGEFTELNFDERVEYLRFYMEYTAGRMELMAGTGCTSLNDTIALTNKAFDMGYTACAVVCPYYFSMDQQRIYQYFSKLAQSVHGDIYIYNYPARIGCSVDPATIRRLAEDNPNIVGLKDSVPDTGHTNSVFRAMEGLSFTVYSGFDDHFMVNAANNGGGGICAMSCAVPEIWSDMVRSVNQGDYTRAVKLHGLVLKLMPIYSLDTTCAAIIRRLLAHRGLPISIVSPYPYGEFSEEDCRKAFARLDSVLEEYQAMGGTLLTF